MTETWAENEELWEALDLLVSESWLPLKELLDIAFEHRDEFQMFSTALLFGGVGTFVRVYHECRSEANTPQQSFGEAMGAVQADRRMQAVFQQATNQVIDAQVERMGEE